ncbi:VOC family protein [Devosia rhizoryzae]|uniref:Glyoxalase/bleomycin resistance/extradiol dioxygenase family protein n=1 Tax=Devosia rhizoryzae TaxID=2774137 RepID=A0ABX7CBJ5_9HYPH|nr:glyoxalase/bleomycin resistance/extradiol dioxygenase family protein [Devosia rhizoryzae]QQR40649.1 glyoxalase/bleomycin resistance/extradiol dioxygenase family protein [Devosia rhizoryzae]
MSEFRPNSGVTPYINVDGAREAIAFYKQAFGAEERETMPAEGSDKLMHAQIDINGSPIFLSDFFPNYGFPPVAAQGFNLHIHVDDAQMWWDRAVGAGCTIAQPLKTEFWGDIYGQLIDPFGVTWAIGQSVKN